MLVVLVSIEFEWVLFIYRLLKHSTLCPLCRSKLVVTSRGAEDMYIVLNIILNVNRFNSIGDFDFFMEDFEDNNDAMMLLETLSYNIYNISHIGDILAFYAYVKEKIKELY